MTYANSVEFGANATHGRIKPVILGGRQRRGHGRTPFRMQSARGLLRTIADDLSCRPHRRSSASVTATNHGFGSGRVGDSRLPARRPIASPERTIDGPHQDVDTGQVESGGVAPRCLLSAPRQHAATVESLNRTHRSSMSSPGRRASRTRSSPPSAPRGPAPAPPRGTACSRGRRRRPPTDTAARRRRTPDSRHRPRHRGPVR